MTSPPTSTTTATKKKSIRELNSIANSLLMSKTLTATRINQQSLGPMTSIENTSNFLNNGRGNSTMKSNDNIGNLLQFYQTLANQNNNISSPLSSSSSSSPLSSFENFQIPTATKRTSSSDPMPMTFLCRFHQRNRLMEVPVSSEFYHQINGISHDNLKQLIEFQLQNYGKSSLIVQIWNEQYQEYIDIESFKRLPMDGRLQVLIENSTGVDASNSKSPPSISTATGSQTPDTCRTPTVSVRSLHLKDENDTLTTTNVKNEQIYDESTTTISPMRPMDNLSCPSANQMYDLLPKPTDGIPIPRFPPHIAAFLNGNGDANQLNALVQALYQEIVKYELYPNADELRSIVSRLVERYPQCISVIGSIELLVRKLYYKFCNERKKYPVELKRRQPNKRKRLIRDDESSMLNISAPSVFNRHQENLSNDFQNSSLDRLMHLWTSTSDYKNSSMIEQIHRSPSDSSSESSSPVSQHDLQKSHPLNLSTTTNTNQLMCTE
uniref:Uncharacterized protein n=1 Tax=Philodina roseola TaxID=96448 RepID=B5AHB6_PHIRO|nr:hypothetical protein 21 [Philodina roseola]